MAVQERADLGERFADLRNAIVAPVVRMGLTFVDLQKRIDAEVAKLAMHAHRVAEQQVGVFPR